MVKFDSTMIVVFTSVPWEVFLPPPWKLFWLPGDWIISILPVNVLFHGEEVTHGSEGTNYSLLSVGIRPTRYGSIPNTETWANNKRDIKNLVTLSAKSHSTCLVVSWSKALVKRKLPRNHGIIFTSLEVYTVYFRKRFHLSQCTSFREPFTFM